MKEFVLFDTGPANIFYSNKVILVFSLLKVTYKTEGYTTLNSRSAQRITQDTFIFRRYKGASKLNP